MNIIKSTLIALAAMFGIVTSSEAQDWANLNRFKEENEKIGMPTSCDDRVVFMGKVQQNGTEQKLLPVESTARIAFEVPADSEESYAILYWNESMNDGAGDWVELSAGEVYEWSEG